MTTPKKVVLGLFLCSFIGYLEWGKLYGYVGLIEWDLLLDIKQSVNALLHPLILWPIVGQLFLVYTLFTKPKFGLVVIAATGIALLYALLLMVGILSWHPKITLLASPYLVFYTLLILKRKSFSSSKS